MTQPGLWELQKGVLTLLSNTSGIQALVGNPARVYDVPPPDATYPFILIGEMHSDQWGARDFNGEKVELSVHAFANANRGSGDIKQIGDAIRLALDNASPSLAAGTVVICQFASAGEEETPDGVTWKGTTKFTIYMQTT